MREQSTFHSIVWQKPSAIPYPLIAGPCSAESEEQVFDTAEALARQGVGIFRASLWKPRTRPGGFEGVGSEGIPWLQRVRDELNLQVTTEVATGKHVEEMLAAGFDTLWIGARTTSSPFAIAELAEALGGKDVTVLVKNPINPDVELWEGALLRLKAAGVKQIGAIHRGFSTYGERKYRNSPLWQIPVELKRRHPDLTLLVDPSHIGGKRELISPLAHEAIARHFDGLIIETHCQPDVALSDKAQQVTPEQLRSIIDSITPPQADEVGRLELQHWRDEIDQIDEELIHLLARRMSLSREIGAYKDRNNLCILQPSRYRELVESRLAHASLHELRQEFVRELFSLVHEESVHTQHIK